MTRCGAKARSTGSPCRRPAGWGTDHNGQGRCRLHGGASPVRHGTYSTVTRRRLGDLIRQHEEHPDSLHLHAELALLRALVEDYIERYDENAKALQAWQRSGGEAPQRPKQVLDLLDAAQVIDRVGAMVQRIHAMEHTRAVSPKDLSRLLDHLVRVIRAHVHDEEILARIARDWNAFRL